MKSRKQSEYLKNPTLLKIELMLRGVRVEGELLDEVMGGAAVLERALDGVEMILSRNTLVNAPYREEFVRDSPYRLEKRRGGYLITDGSGEVKVDLQPLPKFYSGATTTGTPFHRIGVVHGGHVAITPSKRCDFFQSDSACRYCTGNFESYGEKAASYSVDEVLETIEAARREGKARIIYIDIGFSQAEDGGIKFLTPYIEAIKKNFKSLVVVESIPPGENRWIDEAYAAGVDSLVYNIEIFDRELFELICPGRSKLIGRERYVDALRYATTIFPSGTVASHLIVGLEPPGSTIQGIDFLTDLGVIPILPIYRPSPGGTLRIEPLTTEIIAPVYAHLYRAIKEKRINMNWVKDISLITTPIEGRFLVDGGSGFASLVHDFYNTKVDALKATWGISTLIRKLRVQGGGSSGSSGD
ncbi:MAG: radical SAM protein [Thermodesulfobacteriota bacterium]